jgi:hypothetical protein
MSEAGIKVMASVGLSKKWQKSLGEQSPSVDTKALSYHLDMGMPTSRTFSVD